MNLIPWVPVEERIVFPWYGAVAFVAISYGNSILVSAFQPSITRTVITLTFIIGFTYLQFIATLDMPFWALGGLAANWPHNVLSDVERFIYGAQDDVPWQRLRGRPQAEIEKRRTPQTFWGRLVWGFKIACNPRGVSWSYEQKNLPPGPRPGTSRSSYLLRKVSYMLWLVFLKAQVNIIAAHLIADGRYLDDGRGPVTATFYTLPMWERVLAIWLNILNSYYAISVSGSLITVAGVAVGAYEPDECPPVNGSLAEFYTLRKTWGVVWHQHMRRAVCFVGTFLANDILGLKKGTFWSRYILLFAGFLTSGAIHHYASYVNLGHGLNDMPFFAAQALAIFVEDHVILLGQSVGLKQNGFWKLVGFAWLVIWFSITMQYWNGLQIERGVLLIDKPFDPFGLDSWLRRYQPFEYQMS